MESASSQTQNPTSRLPPTPATSPPRPGPTPCSTSTLDRRVLPLDPLSQQLRAWLLLSLGPVCLSLRTSQPHLSATCLCRPRALTLSTTGEELQKTWHQHTHLHPVLGRGRQASLQKAQLTPQGHTAGCHKFVIWSPVCKSSSHKDCPSHRTGAGLNEMQLSPLLRRKPNQSLAQAHPLRVSELLRTASSYPSPSQPPLITGHPGALHEQHFHVPSTHELQWKASNISVWTGKLGGWLEKGPHLAFLF